MNEKTPSLLYVDLTENTLRTVAIPRDMLRAYIGGTGMAAKILWDETTEETAPFSEENPLVFMVGPLTGTMVPSGNRYVAASLSPLTGLWGEAYGGGTFPYYLGQTPYLGIVVKGRAAEPVSLWIDGGGAKIVDARHLWGKDTFEVDEILQREADGKAGVITIGLAGENQVKMASIVGEGRAARVAARCGLGAVMGWKRLKAIVVIGEGKRNRHVVNKEKLRQSVSEHFPRLRFDVREWPERVTRIWPPERAMTAVKNFSAVEFPGFQRKVHGLGFDVKPCYCIGCRSGCFLSLYHGRHKLPPGQHMETLGSNCGIDDMDALLQAFELCDRFGLDSISVGQTIACAMELFENGLLEKKDCDGLELAWGNAQAIGKLIGKIARREGFGALLGEGSRYLAGHTGEAASGYAMQVKGLEFPRYDPRSNNALALQYATSSRGASHMEGFLGIVLHGLHIAAPPYAFPYMKSEGAKNAARDVLAVEGVPELVTWSQDYCSLVDSLGVCKFLANPKVWFREAGEQFGGIKPEQFLTWFNAATGMDMSFREFMQAGERIFTLKRAFNVRRGVRKKDDTLPPRSLTQPRGGDDRDAANLPPLESLLAAYYRLRGWDENGVPRKEKLAELDLL